ncbi:MAG: response regulator transcription factor, partial [Gaiellales bacterium]
MTSGARILVVDDERPIRRALEVTLAQAGYRVTTAGTAREALSVAALEPPDLVLLDMMLPDGDGADVCRRLRDWLRSPILLVSVIEDEAEKVRALDAGADDYMTKPFGVEELLARVRALLRRGGDNVGGQTVIEVPPFRVDLERRMV